MTGTIDVAIVGGGAAGIAAASRLAAKGRSVLLIEALSRLGGRAHTRLIQDMPLDMGCGWLHSAERNPLAALAETKGHAIDHSVAAWGRQLGNINFSPNEQHEAWAAYEAFGETLRNAPPASDRAADALAPNDRWRPFIDGLSSFINGAALSQLSVADFLAYDDAASENNWRLPSGYGAFIASFGDALPRSLDTNVHSIVQGKDIVLTTSRGEIRARNAIIAISTTALAKGGIRFAPDLADHLHAAHCLPLGLANKVFLSLATPEAAPAES
ncbi:MAG: FAD-dependent oxidoreductase, partial [Caulobacterales bacterium]